MSSLDIDRQPAALAPLPEGYHVLFGRLLEVVEGDPRIRALWVSGSLARGVADGGSDLDVLLAIRDQDFDTFAANWRDWLGSVTPTLVARALPNAPGCFYSTTVDCLRLDVVAERVSGVATTQHRRRVVVLDRDGLDATVPAPESGGAPDLDRMAFLVEEFYRQLAIFPMAVAERRDWLLGVAGVHGARQLLYEVFVEANQPLPPMGVKQWSAKLRPAQRTVLEALPPLDSTPASVCAAMRATVGAWSTAGREAVESAGGTWPESLVRTVGEYFDRELVARGHA